MANSDTIFLAGRESLDVLVGWLVGVLALESVDDPELRAGQFFLRGSARTVDGRVLLVVGPNVYGAEDPEPRDVSAIDRYSGVISVRVAGSRNEATQAGEARAIFDELVASEPSVALVLAQAMSWIVAAYLPGAGAHVFPPETSLDVEDIESWRPWVPDEHV
ncbi:hypothetical protein [Kribbella solani]|uniref:Uncharacterized protein n=1 Tax=Kribbella solani TaxID=236067 RepID=A0A841DI71_9ACTN|nr:hypothetical protein [Kribbella solani]MBB5977209.1 hypothetical protein [Kribbella solani]